MVKAALLKCKYPGKDVGMRESLMGERDSKQHLESTGRKTLLLMGATQLGLDASSRALGQTRDPSGLILALRVTQRCINKTIMQ